MSAHSALLKSSTLTRPSPSPASTLPLSPSTATAHTPPFLPLSFHTPVSCPPFHTRTVSSSPQLTTEPFGVAAARKTRASCPQWVCSSCQPPSDCTRNERTVRSSDTE